ncbi:MAG: hypothetical protein JWL85_141 [Candidatus Saccharibacteria bacterium]|nr:hypothetical protein [Candidatus Saccharibacteria bacterium]
MKRGTSSILDFSTEVISLRSLRGRLIFMAGVSAFAYLMPVSALAHLSLWGNIGIPSPSIGLTRAYHHVLHGNFAAAYHQNWLIFVVIVVVLLIIMKDVYNVRYQLNQRILNGRPKQQPNSE